MLLPSVTQHAVCPLHPDAQLKPVLRGKDWMWGIGGEFGYSACPQCSTWVLTPRPVPSEMGAFYAGYYSDHELARWRRAVARRGQRVALRSIFHVRELRDQAALAGCPLPEHPKVLDVGAGLGFFLVAARLVLKAEVRGVDTGERCRTFAKECWDIPVDTGELADQHLPDGTFDLVATRHCLEHVYDPIAELRELHRVIKPGGLLEVEVPTPRILARLFKGRWAALQPPTHLWHFPVPVLHKLAQAAGFDVVATRSVWTISELAGSVLMALGVRGLAPRLMFPERRSRLLMMALIPLGLLDVLVTRVLLAFNQTGSVRLLCRKPV